MVMDKKRKREYDLERNLQRKIKNQEDREIIKKEIIETKSYLKKVWGAPTPPGKYNYKQIKKLGDELGINVYGVKLFGQPEKKLRVYFRECVGCNKKYKIERRTGIKPRAGFLCDDCRKKSFEIWTSRLKIKNKKIWEDKIIKALSESKKKMSVIDLKKELECSNWGIYNRIYPLVEEGKVRKNKICRRQMFWI